ncbi:MAG: ABC transporter ATP-binding protein [Acidobacteria bacterium]|nr:ABC transporter ATP-binding protein [Acidobacteriota bacterium]
MNAISIKALTKTYRSGFIPRRRTVLHGIDIEVAGGEVFGFLGPNGAGKTTTIKAIVGLLQPTSGEIEIFGERAGTIAAKRRIGYLPENPYLCQFLRGRELLEYHADLCAVPRDDSRVRIPEILRQVGLEPASPLPIRKYSKGMVQRLGLAQAMINDPELLILDEPLSGLDPIGRKEFRDIILGLRDRGKTVFFSSHILQDAEMICDRVAIVVGGIVRRIGSLEELATGDIMGYEVELSGCDRSRLADLGQIVVAQTHTVLLRVEGAEELERVVSEIRARGGRLVSVVPLRRTLEDVFMSEIRYQQAGGSS